MKYQLSTLFVILLFAGTLNALSCYHCKEGSTTYNGQEERIPNEVKCANASKINCEESIVSCISGYYMVEGVTLDGTIEVKKKVELRDCHKILTYGNDPCNKTHFDGIILNSFTCNSEMCSKNFCNSEGKPTLTFLGGFFIIIFSFGR